MNCLVILLGQVRASNIVADRFHQDVRSSINPGGRVDLALCRCEGYAEPDPYFAANASYVWECPAPASWNDVFTDVARQSGVANPSAWESLMPIPGNWLGEITEPDGVRPGSAVRCLYLRHYALEMIRRLRLERNYSWFILTRSDYRYVSPHPPLDMLGQDHVWVPRCEAYSGVTDRHIVFPARETGRVLDVLRPLVSDPVGFRRRLPITCDWNLERYLKAVYVANGLYRKLRCFPPTAFLVRTADSDTSWSRGAYDASAGYFVKYPAERQAAVATEKLLKRTGGWRRSLLRQTMMERVDRLILGWFPSVYTLAMRLGPVAGGMRSHCLATLRPLAVLLGLREPRPVTR
jgi:hypothetical protein